MSHSPNPVIVVAQNAIQVGFNVIAIIVIQVATVRVVQVNNDLVVVQNG